MSIAPPNPSWRKPAGIFLILGLIVLWAVVIVTAAGWIGRMPWPIEAGFYVLAGIIWILPLKPLLRWMETGRWCS